MLSPKQSKQPDLSSLIEQIHEYQRRRTYQEHGISRLERSVMDKYERIAGVKRKMQSLESWHEITNISQTFPMELTDCYRLSASPSSSFESLKIITLKDDHIIHEFVRKLRESECACTVIHNFQSFPPECKSIESLVIKAFTQSLYPSHSQLFDAVIQPLFIELIESLKPSEDTDSAQIMKALHHILELDYFQSSFGQNLSSKLSGSSDIEDLSSGKFVLKLLFSLIHHRITNTMVAPLHKVITKLAEGDLVFNAQDPSTLYSLCALCLDAIYECDCSALLDIFATMTDCLHFSVLELPHSECMAILNAVIWKWIVIPIIEQPFRFGFRVSYLTKWQQASCSVFIGVLKDIFNGNNPPPSEHSEYELSEHQMDSLRSTMQQNVDRLGQQLQRFVSFQAQSQAQSSPTASENVSSSNGVHEHNFGILHRWTMISSIELRVLHTVLFSDSSSLSSSQIRDLEKFHSLSFESLDQKEARTVDQNVTATVSEVKTQSLEEQLAATQHGDDVDAERKQSGDGISSDMDSLDVLARSLTDRILNAQFRNSYLFVVGVYPQSDVHRQWAFQSAAKAIETSPLEHLSKICRRNIHYLSKLEKHVQRAPHLFASWCHGFLKLVLNLNENVPKHFMMNIPEMDSVSPSISPSKPSGKGSHHDFESAMGYLELRDVRGPSLLYGLSSKKNAKSADIAAVHFGLKELLQIYPSAPLHWSSIVQWLSLCLAEANKTCGQWHEKSIEALHRVLLQLSSVDRVYRARIDHLKHCLFSTKIHFFAMFSEIRFHQGIPVPDIGFNADGVVEEKRKYIFDFYSDSVPSFLDRILFSMDHLAKFPKAIPILLQKFTAKICDEMKDHAPSSNTDRGMLRGIHHLICVAMYYVLNRPLWVLDQRLNESLERLSAGDSGLDPHRDLGLNPSITMSDGHWRWIGNQLHCLEYHVTPSTKMQCLHEVMQSLTHHLHSHLRWRKSLRVNQSEMASPRNRRSPISRNKAENVTVGADDIFPSLIWLIVENQPQRLASSLALIETVSESPTSGVHAYSFTLFKQAISYIEQLAQEKRRREATKEM